MHHSLIACLCAILPLADGEPPEAPKAILVLKPHDDTARCIAFSPDGKTLATGDHDSVVRLWKLPIGREMATLEGHVGKLGSIAFSPDGRLLASVGGDLPSAGFDGVRIWDVATGNEKHRINARLTTSLAFAPDGKTLALGGMSEGLVFIHDPESGDRVASLPCKPGDDSVLSVAFSRDGRFLAASSHDRDTGYDWEGKMVEDGNGSTITVWERAESGEATLLHRFEKIVGFAREVALSPDGKTLAATTDSTSFFHDRKPSAAATEESKRVRLWDLATGAEKPPLIGHTDIVRGLAFSPDGRLLASASMDKTVRLWDGHTGKELATLSGHTQAVKNVAFSPDGRLLASAGWDTSVRVWDVSGVNEAPENAPESPAVARADAIYIPTGKWFARTYDSAKRLISDPSKLDDFLKDGTAGVTKANMAAVVDQVLPKEDGIVLLKVSSGYMFVPQEHLVYRTQEEAKAARESERLALWVLEYDEDKDTLYCTGPEVTWLNTRGRMPNGPLCSAKITLFGDSNEPKTMNAGILLRSICKKPFFREIGDDAERIKARLVVDRDPVREYSFPYALEKVDAISSFFEDLYWFPESADVLSRIAESTHAHLEIGKARFKFSDEDKEWFAEIAKLMRDPKPLLDMRKKREATAPPTP